MMLLKNMSKYQKLATYSFSTASSYYNILGVQNNATQAEILNAYSNLASLQFPRVFTGVGQATEQQAQEYRNIAEAYAVLSNLESRNNYDLLNKRQPERLLKENRDQQLRDQQRDHTGHATKPGYAKGSYAEERRAVLAEERNKFNVNFLGRYKGGLPQKGKGPIRGSVDGVSLGPPGGHHDILAHTEKTEKYPDHQNITNEMAQDFSQYQAQSSYQDSRRWPAFQAKVDYDYFKFDHYQMGLRYFRNIMIFFFGIPGFAILFAKWRNAFSLRTFKKINSTNPELPVESFGRKVVVGKHGAIKYA